jgi:hypothetical protein
MQVTSLASAYGGRWKWSPRSVARAMLWEIALRTNAPLHPRRRSSRAWKSSEKVPRSSVDTGGSTTNIPGMRV